MTYEFVEIFMVVCVTIIMIIITFDITIIVPLLCFFMVYLSGIF